MSSVDSIYCTNFGAYLGCGFCVQVTRSQQLDRPEIH